MNDAVNKGAGAGTIDPPQHGPIVEIRVDHTPRQIHRGRQSVTAIKEAGKVPLAYDLEQLVDGKLERLADDGSVVIKGGEQFFGHPKGGGTS